MTSLMELPEDLRVEILVKLPASCLVKCQFVCKILYGIIQNPVFLRTFISCNQSNTESMILEYSELTPDWRYRHCFNKLISIDNASRNVCSSSLLKPQIPYAVDGLFVVGSCNGLVCFDICIEGGLDDRYMLWNPVTRQTKSLPRPDTKIPGILPVVEFGFVEETNDYILVKIGTCRIKKGPHQVQLYQMSNDSWRTVYCQVIDEVVDDALNSMIFISRQESPAFLKKSFHWIDDVGHIVSFHLKTEEVRHIRAPRRVETGKDVKNVKDGKEGPKVKVAVVHESLALIYYQLYDNFEIWIMNDYGVQDSWDFRGQVTLQTATWLEPVGYINNDTMLITIEKGTYLLDLGSGRCKEVANLRGLKRFCRFMEPPGSIKVHTPLVMLLLLILKYKFSSSDSSEFGAGFHFSGSFCLSNGRFDCTVVH